MNYRRFKKILVSLALMCVFALPIATTVAPPVYAQSGVYSDVAQYRRYGYGGYRGYYGYPYGGYYRRGYSNPYYYRPNYNYYRPYYRYGYGYGYPYGGYYHRRY